MYHPIIYLTILLSTPTNTMIRGNPFVTEREYLIRLHEMVKPVKITIMKQFKIPPEKITNVVGECRKDNSRDATLYKYTINHSIKG